MTDVTFTRGSDVVYVHCTGGVEEQWDNDIVIVQLPKTTSGSNKETQMLNFLRCKRVFIITGKIGQATTASGVGSDTALQQKDKLRSFVSTLDNINEVVMSYEGVTFKVAINKVNIKEDPSDEGGVPTSYNVILTATDYDTVLGT